MPKPKLTPWEFRKKYTKKPLSKKVAKPLKRTPLKRSNAPIKKVADKRAAQKRKYGPMAIQFKLDRPICEMQLPGCTQVTTDVHHPDGCEGEKLLELDECLAACRSCHRKVTDYSKLAIAIGLSKRRNRSIEELKIKTKNI